MQYDIYCSADKAPMAVATSADYATQLLERLNSLDLLKPQQRKLTCWCMPHRKNTPRWSYHSGLLRSMHEWENQHVITTLQASEHLITRVDSDGPQTVLDHLDSQDQELLGELEDIFESFGDEKEATRFKLLRQQADLSPSSTGPLQELLFLRRLRREPGRVLAEIQTFFAKKRQQQGARLQIVRTQDSDGSSSQRDPLP